MSAPHEDLSEKIGKLLNNDGAIDARMVASGNEDGGTTYAVSLNECEEWRRRVERGVSQKQIADECEHPYPTVKYHARGDCYHKLGGGEGE